jgi:hypothetical protein
VPAAIAPARELVAISLEQAKGVGDEVVEVEPAATPDLGA